MLKACARLLAPAIVAVAGLAGCATSSAPRVAVPTELFADELFGAPGEPVDASRIFAMSDAMQRYARTEMLPLIRKVGAQRALTDALYGKGHLKLDYESAVTRTAAEAFEARAGNCLSLVIMTAAFARELGLPFRYESAYLEETWSRKGNLLLLSGHVNITLYERLDTTTRYAPSEAVTVDFLPPEDLRTLKTMDIPEPTVVAMFMNNRAAEALVQDRLNDAYAWAREAVRADPSFLAAQNTLGVVYLRRGALPQATAAFAHVLKQDPGETRALSNLAEAASREGRHDEAAQLRARLARIESTPPLHYFNQGLDALQRGDAVAARDLLSREARRSDAAEVHFWLGIAYAQLGDVDRATRELTRAAESGATRSERDLYSAKLDRLRAQRAN